MKNIAIIITVFNRKEKTLNCLQMLSKQIHQEDINMNIYITDGGSNDGTVEEVKEKFPEVDIEVRNGVFWNRGMFTSWERAARKQKYDYYLWLNDDVTLYSDCIQTLLSASKEKENKAIIVGATTDTNTKQKLTYGGRIEGKGIPPVNGELTKVDFFNGNIVLIPNSVFDVLGNLDYYYTHSKGDFDYGIRAKKAGIEVFQCGKALGECDEHPRIDKWCDPEVPFKDRWKMLYKPNGMPPHETFHLEKQTGFAKAIFHYFTVHLRCLFPQIWTRRNNKGA